MKRWLEEANARQSRPYGWVTAILAAMFSFIAALDAFVVGPSALRHALMAISFLFLALANLVTFRRKWASTALGLTGAVLLLGNAVQYFATRFS